MDTPAESEGKGELMIRFASDGREVESNKDDQEDDQELETGEIADKLVEDEDEDDDDEDDGNTSANRQGNENENSEPRLNVDNRRASYGYGITLAMRRASSITRRVKLAYEPTYRMEPKPGGYFIWYKVRNMIAKVVSNLMIGFQYDPRAAATTCKLLCQKILLQAKKKFDYPRYRYVIHVTIAQLSNQGIIIADRSLWMAGIDSYAPFIHQSKTHVCVITFHAIYLE